MGVQLILKKQIAFNFRENFEFNTTFVVSDCMGVIKLSEILSLYKLNSPAKV